MSLSEKKIRDNLNRLTLPDGRGLVDAGMIRSLEVEGSTVRLLLAVDNPSLAAPIKAEVERLLGEEPGVETIRISVPAGLPTAEPGQPASPKPAAHAWADHVQGISRIIAVASGKGGVGKSTVAANLALALASQGRAVGLLDADIYGPSQQLMMGANGQPAPSPNGKILPIEVASGVKVMSFGSIIDPDQPVIWRGPMLMKALEQFVGDVEWGELDDLIIDLPPGTGDVALTLSQNVPLTGTVIVTTPQDVALIDARKGLHMFTKLGVRVLGIVENMAHFECPSCGHREHIFGGGGGERTAAELGVPFLGAIPLDPAVVLGGDTGRPVVCDRPDSLAARSFVAIAERLGE